jgi:hypothetical protein
VKLIANGFSTDVPAGWEDRTLTTLVGPTGSGGFAANVVVTRERVEAGVGLEAYARAQLQATSAEIPGLEVLDERPATLDGGPAFQRLQRFSAGGRRIQQAQTYRLAAGVAFVITCSAQQEDFDSNLASFERIVRSFRFFDPAAVSL